MKKLLLIATTGLFSIWITGCASIVNGQYQPVSISTPPLYGANCSLENNKGKWYIPSTPGRVTVHRSYNKLQVNCKKKGYRNGLKSVASSTKAMAFGNIVFGGVVGAGVDMATGSAYDYPTEIIIPMEKG